MSKCIIKKFSDFKSRNNLSNETIAKMISEYANSDLCFARTHFKEKYGISTHVFYKARDFAVIFGLVDSKTCQKVRDKAAANYSSNNVQNTARDCLAHFNELLQKRKEVISTFSDNEIRDIGFKYVSGITVSKIAVAYDVGECIINHLITKGIVELIFNKSIVIGIQKNMGAQLDRILEKRENNKKALLGCFATEIESLKRKLNCYNAYVRFSTDIPSKDILEKKLSDTIKMYNEALQL